MVVHRASAQYAVRSGFQRPEYVGPHCAYGTDFTLTDTSGGMHAGLPGRSFVLIDAQGVNATVAPSRAGGGISTVHDRHGPPTVVLCGGCGSPHS